MAAMRVICAGVLLVAAGCLFAPDAWLAPALFVAALVIAGGIGGLVWTAAKFNEHEPY